ncbi:MAG TPA: hypothetical protein VJN88_11615 [Ktedonobacterales bacterium]|nr:hypothetical protein [Ktedonobacterales bacterium]
MRLRENRVATSGRSAIFIALEGVVWDRRELAERGPLGANALAGALDGLRLLARAEVPLYLVANGRELPRADPCAELARLGVLVAGLITCPHGADVVSRRKALTKELRRRARQDELALATSLFIGDTWSLAEAALGLGCQPVLVMTGRGRAQIALPQTTTVRARTWYAADMALAACSALAHFLGDDPLLTTLALPQERERSTVA